MDIRLIVTLCGVLFCQVHGHPRAAEESAVTSSGDTKKIVPLEISTTKEVKKTTGGEKDESTGSMKASPSSLGAKLKARLLEDSKLSTTSSKESQDEAVRSARQSPFPPFRQMSIGRDPHLTTVCIQVRSDHTQPQVICGPQLGEREEPSPTPAAARFSSPYEYGRAAPQGPLAPARAFPTKRTEEDLRPRPVDPNFQPATGGLGPLHPQPLSRDYTSGPSGPVYGPRQYYQPVYAPGIISPAQALMRLNCAVEPSGQLISPPLVRGGALGYQDQSLGDPVFILPDGSPAKFGANVVSPNPIRTQNTVASPQGPGSQWSRSSAYDDVAYLNSQMMGSPQNYMGEYQGEYPGNMMQGRSASGQDSSYAYLGYPAAEYPDSEDPARKEYLQLQALRESQERLRDIQDQLNAFKEREAIQKLNSRNSSEPGASKDSSATGPTIDLKTTSTKKTQKRHT